MEEIGKIEEVCVRGQGRGPALTQEPDAVGRLEGLIGKQ